ncbi:MAG: cytochrome c oxidase subunit 3 [Ferrimonas sp.]
MTQQYQRYYVPAQSPWPIVGAIALAMIAVGAGNFVVSTRTDEVGGYWGYLLLAGLALLLYMLIGWFRNVIDESMSGLYSAQMDRSFKQGMAWFIFSEMMFFFAFFGALFYTRLIAVPWLAGAGNNAMTNQVLWPDFEAIWPLVLTPGGITTTAMGWVGLPLYNTLILIVSSVTLHLAHSALEQNKRAALKGWLMATIALGLTFLGLQVEEYYHAYQVMGLTLDSGVYGNTFFLLTGFHGLHVTLGVIMLTVMSGRIFKGHFTPEKHFGFQASSWYWHFVDVVWLCLFVFVYVL